MMLFRVPLNAPKTPPKDRLHRTTDALNASGVDQLISEELFVDAIGRERKRADRFEEAFVVLLVMLDRRLNQSSLPKVVEAMSALQPGADVIGWFERDSVLGLLRSVDARDAGSAASALADAFRRELARCLPTDQADCCSILCEPYSSGVGAMAPVLVQPVSRRRRWARAVGAGAKRLLDIAGSVTALVLFAPVFLGAAAIVKLTSSGPVFFRQKRVGEAGQPFTMFKFRTMQVNCDPGIHKQYVEGFIQAAPTATQGAAPFKIVNDPRLTPVGSFLRRSSIDELPQLWNVLRGEMSLVGPRPPLPYEVARYKRWHHRRVLEAKPGMTGLWQVKGRSRTTFDDMVRLDLRYAANSSVWTDCKILLATPKAVLSGKGAR
jgi:lipopolysaccharide/colanic/teichoic acid biosynthesis glycosyltransferase